MTEFSESGPDDNGRDPEVPERAFAETRRSDRPRIALRPESGPELGPESGPESGDRWENAPGLWSGLRDFTYWAATIAFALAGLGIFGLLFGAFSLPDPRAALAVSGQRLVFYDASGTILGERGDRPPDPIDVSTLPRFVVGALLAAEDRRFYQHAGIDPIGVARAAAANLFAGKVVQGGSTITQQLAKNLFLSNARTFQRKSQEFYLALWLEANLSKNEILGLYLSRVYFGAGAYGLEAAARRYFAKPARDLTLPEAALLAGLLRAPSRDGPLANLERAKARTQSVLFSMAKTGQVSEDQWRDALFAPVRVRPNAPTAAAAWALDLAAREARDILADSAFGEDQTPAGEIRLFLTLDSTLQRAAEKAVAEHFPKSLLAGAPDLQTAFIALGPDGGIRALLGGRDYGQSSFNRATDAKRQTGSAFKPFLFLAALEYGLRPEQVVPDLPFQYDGWTPKNFDDSYRTEIPLALAFAESRNAPAAFIANQIGLPRIVETARRLGLPPPQAALPAIALGANEASAAELVAAYAPFMNGGFAVKAHIVREIRIGAQILRPAPAKSGRAAAEAHLGTMRLLMAKAVRDGTGRAAAIPGRVIMGKTGTTNDHRDAWFIGFSGNILAGVWMGRDQPAGVNDLTGGGAPAAIWRAFAEAALPRDVMPAAYAPPVLAPPSLESPSPEPGELAQGEAVASLSVPETAVVSLEDAARPPPAKIAAIAPAPVTSASKVPAKDAAAPPAAPAEEAWLADLEGFVADSVKKKGQKRR